LRPFHALREKFKEGYTTQDFRADLMAGIIVGMVALPLGMALAIASGAAPQYGLYTVIIAGIAVALVGGSRYQVTGPTAAFVVLLAPIVTQFGFAGLLVAGFMSGVILVAMGVARMGRLIQFIPYPVTVGFTAGIGLVIATLQIKDFFGLTVVETAATSAHGMTHSGYVSQVGALIHALPTISWVETSLGLSTLAILLLWPRLNKKIPAPLVALAVVSIGAALLHFFWPEITVSTIGSKFGGIPHAPPHFKFPWEFIGPDGKQMPFTFQTIEVLFPAAFAIAMLGAIESLLSAVIADGMTHTKHDPDAELLALGVGNIICPFFGGIPATGAIARTATNIRSGARSPIAVVIHGLFVLLAILVFSSWVSYVPMAGLAALLILVAYNMSDLPHFTHIIQVGPRSDVAVLLICFGLTAMFNMVVGVSVGMILAAFLLIQRMSDLTSGRILSSVLTPAALPATREIMIYEVAGPLFFGAAERAISAIHSVANEVKVVIFMMDDVPAMDVTGLVALESTIRRLHAHGKVALFVNVQSQPKMLLKKSGVLEHYSERVFDSYELAMEQARKLVPNQTAV
jgi:sulfate permease, SulP family